MRHWNFGRMRQTLKLLLQHLLILLGEISVCQELCLSNFNSLYQLLFCVSFPPFPKTHIGFGSCYKLLMRYNSRPLPGHLRSLRQLPPSACSYHRPAIRSS